PARCVRREPCGGSCSVGTDGSPESSTRFPYSAEATPTPALRFSSSLKLPPFPAWLYTSTPLPACQDLAVSPGLRSAPASRLGRLSSGSDMLSAPAPGCQLGLRPFLAWLRTDPQPHRKASGTPA